MRAFSINAINLDNPFAFVNTDAGRLTIRLPKEIHLWTMNLALAGMRIYWTGEGLRPNEFNIQDGIAIPATLSMEEIQEIGKCIVDRTCMVGNPNQPNLLHKMLDRRSVVYESVPYSTGKEKQKVIQGSYLDFRYGTRIKDLLTGMCTYLPAE